MDEERFQIWLDTLATAYDKGKWPRKDFSANQVYADLTGTPFVTDTLSRFMPTHQRIVTHGEPGTISSHLMRVQDSNPVDIQAHIGTPWRYATEYDGEFGSQMMSRLESALSHEMRHRSDYNRELNSNKTASETDAVAFAATMDAMRDLASSPMTLREFRRNAQYRAMEGMRDYGLWGERQGTPDMISDDIDRAIEEIQKAGFLKPEDFKPTLLGRLFGGIASLVRRDR